MFKGINAGLKMIAQAVRFRYRAQKAADVDAIAGIDQVQALWFQEITGLAIVSAAKDLELRIGLGNLMFGDPFEGSRFAFRALCQQFPQYV